MKKKTNTIKPSLFLTPNSNVTSVCFVTFPILRFIFSSFSSELSGSRIYKPRWTINVASTFVAITCCSSIEANSSRIFNKSTMFTLPPVPSAYSWIKQDFIQENEMKIYSTIWPITGSKQAVPKNHWKQIIFKKNNIYLW